MPNNVLCILDYEYDVELRDNLEECKNLALAELKTFKVKSNIEFQILTNFE